MSRKLAIQSHSAAPLKPVVSSYVYDEKTGFLTVCGRAIPLPLTLQPTYYEIWLGPGQATIWFLDDAGSGQKTDAALRIDGYSFDVLMHKVEILYLMQKRLTDVILTITLGKTYPVAGQTVHLPQIAFTLSNELSTIQQTVGV